VEVTIRVYDPRDAADLADVFFRSVRQVALSDYTAAQVRAWAPEPRTAEWAHTEARDGRPPPGPSVPYNRDAGPTWHSCTHDFTI